MKTSKAGIRLMFALSFLVLLASSIGSYLSISKLNESGDWVRHTFLVIEKLDSVVSRMKDAETGYRGYLLTGNTVFLEPYNGSQVQVEHALNVAEQLTRDNLKQQESFPLLRSLIEEKYRLAGLWVSQKQSGEAVSTEKMLRGKQVMDSIRKVVGVMKQRELVLKGMREQTSSRFVLYTPILILVGALIAIALTLVFYIRLKRDLVRNEQLQAELEYTEKDRNRQIDIIQDIAKKIAAGDYSARVDIEALKDDGNEKDKH